jgi:hypothetical protein
MLYCLWRLMKKLASGPMPVNVLCSDNSQDLKRFSIYDLYQDCNLRGQGLTFNSAAWSKPECKTCKYWQLRDATFEASTAAYHQGRGDVFIFGHKLQCEDRPDHSVSRLNWDDRAGG